MTERSAANVKRGFTSADPQTTAAVANAACEQQFELWERNEGNSIYRWMVWRVGGAGYSGDAYWFETEDEARDLMERMTAGVRA